jgi:peptidyl-prolyl cis-trans isomerase C
MAGCTKADTPAEATAKPVAVVNGTPISRDVWDLYVKTRHQGNTPGDLTAEEQNAALDELVKMYVGAQEAEKQKLGEGEPNARLELVGKSARAELLFKKFTEGKEPTEEAKAKELIAQLDKGGNFEQLAKDNSKDGSATEGGDLGWFNANQMVKPFSDAVQQLEPGKYTAAPVKSEFGWHVIKLEEKRASAPPPFESVKAQLGPLVNQKKFEAHLDELVKTAKVEKSL